MSRGSPLRSEWSRIKLTFFITSNCIFDARCFRIIGVLSVILCLNIIESDWKEDVFYENKG